MKCTYCGHPVTWVVWSIPRDDGDEVYVMRRRECKACGERWTTKEQMHVPEVESEVP